MILFDPQSVQLVPLTAHIKFSANYLNGLDHRYTYEVSTLKLKTTFSIQDKNSRDLDNAKNYSTLKELVEDQGVSSDLSDYWDKECELNPSDPRCLVYED